MDTKKKAEKKYHNLTNQQKCYIKVKNLLDRVLAVVGLIVLSPVFLAVIVMCKIEDGWKAPVFFSQKRVGLHKKHFKLYKFRSMKLDTPHDTPTHLLENPEQYITKVGKFLRKTSLDELPQLWNIAKGDMAVIGPRPALWNQFDLIEERDRYGVHQIKPGLTGWAQIHGRDELEIEEKARLDGYYLKHLGPAIDVKCFLGTIVSVLKSDGVVEGGTGTMHGLKKKILVITNHSYMLWQFRRELIAELAKNHEVVLSMPFVGHEDDFQTMGVKCIKTDVDRRGINPVTDMALIRQYYRILTEEKPDMVITYSIKPNIYAGFLCGAMNIPFCANVQGLGTAFQKKRLAAFVTLLYRIAFRKVKVVFFENASNAQEFRKRHIIAEEKEVVLHGAGINLEHYMYQPYPANDLLHFLYLGRIMKEKGMDELFSAAERLHEEGEKFVLDLVGFFEDEYKEQVETLQKKGIVVFHGFQAEPGPFYAAADCIVMPSYHEGMSNVNLEAAATGRPVITTNIPGCREAVENGKTGFLCKVKDTDSLYRAMKKVLTLSPEERAAMGKAGREKMVKEFDKKEVVRNTISAMEIEKGHCWRNL
ncbi:MAG: sugar transferase [Lachnospiraceae bacterium]|nr:sugar transferase [Lachnospiraceae bacterium]